MGFLLLIMEKFDVFSAAAQHSSPRRREDRTLRVRRASHSLRSRRQRQRQSKDLKHTWKARSRFPKLDPWPTSTSTFNQKLCFTILKHEYIRERSRSEKLGNGENVWNLSQHDWSSYVWRRLDSWFLHLASPGGPFWCHISWSKLLKKKTN